MEGKRPSIAVMGHVDHGKTTLSAATMSAAAIVASKLASMNVDVNVVGLDEFEKEHGINIQNLNIEDYEPKTYELTAHPSSLEMFHKPETRTERRKRIRNGKKARNR